MNRLPVWSEKLGFGAIPARAERIRRDAYRETGLIREKEEVCANDKPDEDDEAGDDDEDAALHMKESLLTGHFLVLTDVPIPLLWGR